VADIDAPASIHFWLWQECKRIHSIMTLPPRFDPAKNIPGGVSAWPAELDVEG